MYTGSNEWANAHYEQGQRALTRREQRRKALIAAVAEAISLWPLSVGSLFPEALRVGSDLLVCEQVFEFDSSDDAADAEWTANRLMAERSLKTWAKPR